MATSVGCFAPIHSITTLDAQLDELANYGFKYADVAHGNDDDALGTESGATASIFSNDYAQELKRSFDSHGLAITSLCVRANLLDPSAPWRSGTSQILEAVRAAGAIGAKYVITSEGAPRTEIGMGLKDFESVFIIRDKLYEPLRSATDLGVKILFESDGPLSTSIDHLEWILDVCDSAALAVNLDTGSLWMGGGDPVECIERLGDRIKHVHWKDVPKAMESQRGTQYGGGLSDIPLGSGCVDLRGTFAALEKAGFSGQTTIKVIGQENLKNSYAFLQSLGAV